MPSFCIRFSSKQRVYNLYDEIVNQIPEEIVGVKLSSQWPAINIQASMFNTLSNGDPIPILTGTDSNLSGLRHGRVLLPGDIMNLSLGNGKFVSTKSLYFFFSVGEGAQLNIDLIGGVGVDDVCR
jgi:hypothetical protein